MQNTTGPDRSPDADPSPENSAAVAGSESPEEGAAAMAAAEDAIIDPDTD